MLFAKLKDSCCDYRQASCAAAKPGEIKQPHLEDGHDSLPSLRIEQAARPSAFSESCPVSSRTCRAPSAFLTTGQAAATPDLAHLRCPFLGILCLHLGLDGHLPGQALPVCHHLLQVAAQPLALLQRQMVRCATQQLRHAANAAQQLPSNGALSCRIRCYGKSWLSPCSPAAQGRSSRSANRTRGQLHLAFLQVLQVVAQRLLSCNMPGVQSALQLVKEAVCCKGPCPSVCTQSSCCRQRLLATLNDNCKENIKTLAPT